MMMMMSLNKVLNKQRSCQWIETSWPFMWRHYTEKWRFMKDNNLWGKRGRTKLILTSMVFSSWDGWIFSELSWSRDENSLVYSTAVNSPFTNFFFLTTYHDARPVLYLTWEAPSAAVMLVCLKEREPRPSNNTLKLKQNGHHHLRRHFQMDFFKENHRILIQNSLTFTSWVTSHCLNMLRSTGSYMRHQRAV